MSFEQFKLPAVRTVSTVEEVAFELRTLNLERGTPSQPARIVILLQAVDEAGEWDESIEPIRVNLLDTDEAPRATLFRGLVLDAILPDTPQIRGLEQQVGAKLVGEPVRVAGRALLLAFGGLGG